jgi:hypothetical protein
MLTGRPLEHQIINMFITLPILVLLIFATPLTIIFDGPIVQGLIAAVAAVSLAFVAVRIRPGEAGFLSTLIWPMAAVAAVPAIWMLIQVMPMQSVGLAHPIWNSAAAALGKPLAGSISIDTGTTLISLVRYLSAIAIVFVSAAVGIDRRRAEWVLFALTAATTLVAVVALAINLGVLTIPGFGGGGQADATETAIACLGAIFATAAAFLTSERKKVRPQVQTDSNSLPAFVASLSALAICLLVVVIGATGQAYFAVMCGMATLVIAVIIRRFDLGPWGIAAIISIALLVATAVVAFQLGGRTSELTLAFASHAPAPLITVTQRILADMGWAGSGAGTFAAVLPIYQGIDELTTGQNAPTAAAAIAIEMGRPFFWATLLAATTLVLILLRGALRRQRDSFYAMAGAGCVVTNALLSFGNPALLSTPIAILTAAVVGVGIAQSKSRLT